MPRKAIFLDRDGTINIDRGYVSRIDQWEFVPGAIEALRSFAAAGFALAIVTNQSGIARGYYTADDVERLHAHVRALLATEGVALDAVAYCPHAAEDDCRCRKPRTGMADQIAAAIGEEINYQASWTIGDKPADVQFGANLGMRTVLLESQYWQPETLSITPTHIAPRLSAAARIIL